MESVEARVLLRGLARRATSLAADHGAKLEARLEETGLVRVDPVRVEQAILALVDNAIKYGPQGQNITLRSTAEGGELRVEVGDRGPQAYPKPNWPTSSNASTGWRVSTNQAAASDSRSPRP
jgi:signal transduction histidine kinase